MAARASRTENQDAIDAAIVGMLADPKEVAFGSHSLSEFYYVLSSFAVFDFDYNMKRHVLEFEKYTSFLSTPLIKGLH